MFVLIGFSIASNWYALISVDLATSLSRMLNISLAVLANTPSGNYKIIVTGNIEKSITGGWSVTASMTDRIPDTRLNLLGWLPDVHWPWETDFITVQCTMINTISQDSYEGDCGAGRVNSWIGGSTNYELEIRNVPVGTYTVKIQVFEGDENRISKNIGTWNV